MYAIYPDLGYPPGGYRCACTLTFQLSLINQNYQGEKSWRDLNYQPDKK